MNLPVACSHPSVYSYKTHSEDGSLTGRKCLRSHVSRTICLYITLQLYYHVTYILSDDNLQLILMKIRMIK